MQVLVTGANGFVGSHVVDALLEGGHGVSGLVRRTSNLIWLKGKPVELRYGDVRESESLGKALERVEWVIHTAGLIKAVRPSDFYRVNAGGVKNLLRACAGSETVRGVVCLSSLAVSGPSPSGRPLKEGDPCRPITDYGKSKLEGERIALSYGDRFAVVALRPPAIFGPRDRATFPFFKMASRGLCIQVGLGEMRLSLCYAPELARACVAVLEAAAPPSGAYFVCAKKAVSYGELIGMMGDATGTRPRRIVLPRMLVSSAALFSEALGRLRGTAPHLSLQKVRELSQPAWVCDPGAFSETFGFTHREDLSALCAETALWYGERGWL